MKLDILLETADFIAINKPSGLLSVPDRKGDDISLKVILKEKFGDIFVVHRIDRFTSGIIVFAKNEEAHKTLSQLFEGREVQKFYNGIVHGIPVNKTGSVDAALMEHPAKNGKMVANAKGKASLTDYEIVESFRLYSFMKFQIHTGRTHQIRVHMAHIGHPIICDELYGNGQPLLLSSFKKKFNLGKKEDEERPLLNRLALHAHKLIFTFNDEQIVLEAALPKDFRATLTQLKNYLG